ncbi:MAG: DNA repair and recombination protein RadB [Candidatus Aenigmatarchaeota archaeon]
MERLPTNSPLDKILGGGIEYNAITNVYGEAGSGKTNLAILCMLSAIKKGKKVIFIDTEGGFSFERLDQLANGNGNEYLKSMIFFEPKTWEEQCERINKIENIIEQENVGLIVVDSIVSLYRLELNSENFQEINRQLSKQYSILSNISRSKNIPVLVTNQVYSTGSKIEMTSRTIGKYWAKALIRLEKLDRFGHRSAIIVKHRSLPEGRRIEFIITQNGLKEVGKLSIF